MLMIYEINHIWTAEMKWKWRNDRRSERNLWNCVKKPEFFFSGFFTQLHKLRSLRRSFLHFQNDQFSICETLKNRHIVPCESTVQEVSFGHTFSIVLVFRSTWPTFDQVSYSRLQCLRLFFFLMLCQTPIERKTRDEPSSTFPTMQDFTHAQLLFVCVWCSYNFW